MALIDDINALPTTVGDGQTGHLQNHATIHAALKHHEAMLGARDMVGTGSPVGRVSATIGTTYTDTAATNGAIRWIKASGSGTTGWQVEYGDTGKRRLTSSAATGAITIRRIANHVTLTLEAVQFGSLAGTQVIADIIPSGFRTVDWVPFSTVGVYGPVVHGRTHQGANLQLFGLTSGDSLRVNIVYTADDPWPTILPGTPI